MTAREIFINEITEILTERNADISKVLSKEAFAYWGELQKGKASAGGMTEMGEKILTYMLANEKERSNSFSAAIIGEGLFASPRSVTGAIRKLITDGYVEKTGANPSVYSLTDTARNWQN